MLSAKIWMLSTRATMPPSVAVIGTNSRTAARSSADPTTRSYGKDAPIEYQSTPIGEKLPYGSSRRVSDGAGICNGMNFAVP